MGKMYEDEGDGMENNHHSVLNAAPVIVRSSYLHRREHDTSVFGDDDEFETTIGTISPTPNRKQGYRRNPKLNLKLTLDKP